MFPQAISEEDRAAQVIPPVHSRMPWRVAAIAILPAFRLSVEFQDATKGIVDMAPLVHSRMAGVFAVLADAERFAEARVKHGAVTWPGDIDLAPDAMYRAIKVAGIWVPE